MSNILDIGAGIGQQVAQGALGIGLAAYNDNRQEIQNRKFMNQQLGMNKEMADYNMQKQMEMWEKTNYSAQMAQMKKAGINPALLYGMSGGGGVTTGNPGGSGVSSATAQQNPGDVQGIMGIGLNSALIQAQIDNIKADTKVKEGDAANKPKIGENIDASTGLIKAQTGNTEADTALTKINTDIATAMKKVQEGTIEEQIKLITQTAANATEETTQMIVKTNIDRATQNTVIDTVRANLVGQLLQNALTKKGIEKTAAETMAIAQEIAQGWRDLDIRQAGVDQQRRANDIQKNYTEKLINLGVGEEVIQGVGTILQAFNPLKGGRR